VARRPLITANAVTVTRLLLIPVPAYLLYTNTTGQWIAVGLGTLLGITDAIDGILARKYGPTVLGALLDPVADKVFLAATYTPLADIGVVPPWAVALLFVRELSITSLRSVFERRHLRLETSYVAKVKTWIQMVGLVLFVFVGPLREEHPPVLVMSILAAGGLVTVAALALRRSRHTSVAVVLTAWAALVAIGEHLWGIGGSVPVLVALILGATWWSGLEYVVGGARQLRGARALDMGDFARLAGALIAILAVLVLERTHMMSAIALLLSVELAHGGLDNLVCHHKADLPWITWAARVLGVSAALGLALARPDLASVGVGAALAISLGAAGLAFWRRRAVYLSDAALDEQLP
jgi:CDP-diacylglycerol--glycerol-3-phosphate 3-phosphatidyltransferase